MGQSIVMEEVKIKYYKGVFFSQFTAEKAQTMGGVYKHAPIQLEQRFRLVVESEISKEEYFKAKDNRLSASVVDWQKEQHLRHVSQDTSFQVEPHALLEESHPIELELGTKATKEVASEIYVEFAPNAAGNAYDGFEFLAFKEGLWHGRFQGQGYCAIPQWSDKDKEDQLKLIADRDTLLQSRKGCMGSVSRLSQRRGCGPLGMMLSPTGIGLGPGGCLSAGGIGGGCMQGGCGKLGCGILGLLALLLLLFSLLKGCSDQMERSQGPRVIHDTVYVDEKSKEDIIKKFMDTTTISKTEAIELPNVQFYTNSANLLPYSISSIQQLAEYLNEHPEVQATIVGHTDNVGDATANLNLSKARAETVKKVLLSFGVDGARVQAVGKGESQPRTTNDTVEGRALNRRVEVQLTNTETTETKSTEVNE
jgi:outer membrane protein OmpA-like peptidoglycan-associated protein